eukprot:CAMPEP_0176343240 /NCGR_PEP_ID=MMETSP0126-20121128/3801_1 /TAXON_ID=141414 ORGANISM="Strombidinopsis acuminatum, Strain SPMC142" /NCGR_SAMPLE_ID=MMETSP0126 /ASSEMBLY_ACC=CAM_ASM_000229 /LENGTH=80 /DNA_ID=CAMNT_0017689101 /DNA_START=204 /DNA_END=446 /DNA_ORIENTATION=-
MKVYSHPDYQFLHDQKNLSFDWMEKQGRNIEVVADDLIELAKKNGFDNHRVPEEVNTEMKEMLKEYKPLLAEVKQKMKNF